MQSDSLGDMHSFWKYMMVISAAIFMIAFFTCVHVEKGGKELPSKSDDDAILVVEKIDLGSVSVMISDPLEEALAETVDPYKNWEGWCENLFKMGCNPSGPEGSQAPDGPDCPVDRTGRSQKCVRPWWAKREGSGVHLCAPRPLNRSKQKTHRKSQRIIVDSVCRPPDWYENEKDQEGKSCWRFKWQTAKDCNSKHWCNPEKLHRFLRLIVKRESAWDNETSHELNPDREANKSSYRKAKARGWYEGNEHFSDPDRWQRGYGWYGHNAALKVAYWDRQAPPEILCRQVESTEVHLRSSRKSFVKLWKKYKNTETIVELSNGKKATLKGVTWYDVHRASSSGKLTRPEVISVKKGGFVSRAKAVDLNPFETVMFEMLADPIPREEQNQVAESIRQKIVEHFTKGRPGELSTMSP